MQVVTNNCRHLFFGELFDNGNGDLGVIRQELPLFTKSGKKIPKAFLMLAVKQGEAN